MSKRSQCHRKGLGAAASIVAFAAMAMTTTAHAQMVTGPDPSLPVAPIGDSVVENSTGFDVLVAGRIPSRCALGRGGDIDFGELTGGLQRSVAVGLDCNVPFDLSVKAANGAIAHTASAAGEGGFSGRLSYDLGIELPLSAPRIHVVSQTVGSHMLLSGLTISSGNAIAAGGVNISFMTKNPEGLGLLAGDYSETIMMTISPRM